MQQGLGQTRVAKTAPGKREASDEGRHDRESHSEVVPSREDQVDAPGGEPLGIDTPAPEETSVIRATPFNREWFIRGSLSNMAIII